jgi:Carboxypeptidase regulatory-like domain
MIKHLPRKSVSPARLTLGILGALAWISVCGVLGVVLCDFPALAQSQQPPSAVRSESTQPTSGKAVPPGAQESDAQSNGSISGTVVDQNGAAMAGAHVTLARGDATAGPEAVSDAAGQFFFVNIAPGPFRLTITAPGFGPQTVSGALHSGEAYTVPPVVLAVAGLVTEVRVMPRVEQAEAQIKEQEKQRVLGVPNFYVTYVPDAVPLDTKQKFELSWKSIIDPVAIVLTGGSAGIQQAANQYSGYGQGAQGYGKRFGADYADVTISSLIGDAMLPSLFKQDPRFFYKEDGSKRARALYAIATSVICKGDNGRWQPNYSGILGTLAAGGISNLYYPPQNRNDAAVTFEGAAVAVATTAGENLLEEFVVPKFTRKKPAKPASNGIPDQP